MKRSMLFSKERILHNLGTVKDKRSKRLYTLYAEASWPSSRFKFQSDHCLYLFHGSLEFKSSATLLNSQLDILRPVLFQCYGVFSLNYFSVSIFCSTPLAFVLQTLPRVNKGYFFVYCSFCVLCNELHISSFLPKRNKTCSYSRFYGLRSIRSLLSPNCSAKMLTYVLNHPVDN